jgi:hypothetical protein
MQADAIVAIYRPGDGGGDAVAKILFGDAAPRGKLPWHLPRSMDQVGDESKNQNERWDLPFDVGATGADRPEEAGATDVRRSALPVRRRTAGVVGSRRLLAAHSGAG